MARPDFRERPRLRSASAVVALVIAVGFGAVNGGMYAGEPLDVDITWMAVFGPGHSAWLPPALLLDYAGSGIPAFVLATLIAVALLIGNRPWGAAYFVAAAIASTALVELLKTSIRRPRPENALIDVGFGSYPSGHSARAAMLAVALGILLPRLWVWMLGAGYTLAMMFSRTQLGAHWLTDTIGGALVGAAVALLCFAVVAGQLQAEGARAHPPPWKR